MTARVAILAVILLAGCAGAPDAPVVEHPFTGKPREACLRVQVAAAPGELRPGDNTTIYVTIDGCSGRPVTLRAQEGCTKRGFHPRLVRGEEVFHLWNGTSARRDAPDPNACPPPTGEPVLVGRTTIGDSFTWDGREVQPGIEPERRIRMVAGTYLVLVRVDTVETEPSWGYANVTLR